MLSSSGSSISAPASNTKLLKRLKERGSCENKFAPDTLYRGSLVLDTIPARLRFQRADLMFVSSWMLLFFFFFHFNSLCFLCVWCMKVSVDLLLF